MSTSTTRSSIAALLAALVLAVLVLGGVSSAQGPTAPSPGRDVRVVNGVGEPVPVQQQGSSHVTVDNLPATQAVSGTVGLAEGTTVGVASSEENPVIVQQVDETGAPAVHEPFYTVLDDDTFFEGCDSLFFDPSVRDIVIETITIDVSAPGSAHPQVYLNLVTDAESPLPDLRRRMGVALDPAGNRGAQVLWAGQLHGPFHIGPNDGNPFSPGPVDDLELCIEGPEAYASAVVTGYYTS